MMSASDLDVICIGNAIVDVMARCSDQTIIDLGLERGAMTLIDADQAESLYSTMGPALETSGGSACNTAAGVASFGGTCGYVGKVRDDQLGDIFTHDIRNIGAVFETPAAKHGPPTARCFIFVTPDAQRTMNTYLGACVGLTADDIDSDLIARGKVTYLEGYLWDPDEAKQAFLKAARLSHVAQREVALTLSDAFCVDRHRDSFLDLVNNHVDLLFANEDELLSLYQTANFEEAVQAVRGACSIAAVTRSEKGSVIITKETVHEVKADPVNEVVDTTGAGDLYAAGFLHGYTNGAELPACGRLGSLAAAEVISHIGPRPATSLASLAKKAGIA